MLFNSIDFAIFCPIVFILYWFVFNKSVKQQNLLVILASFVFYGWWDWRFLTLLIISASTDFIIGVALDKTSVVSKRKGLLLLSILVNLGLLGFFKYADFFVGSFATAYSFFGATVDPVFLNIILPVGISFYTFQTLGYSIDVYRKTIPATRDLFSFFAFVSFFPQLVAGPIERAGNLLPQFVSARTFNQSDATDGMRQILWGLFKKVVVADNCGQFINKAFDGPESFTGSSLLIASCLFSIQIYCDFSGYSDIAIGTAKLFGIKLRRNFAYPFFSTGFIEFWRRWHISLTSWFKDYVYIPLGGNRISTTRTVFNILLVFVLSGLWHGANWTFVAWGLTNAFYFTIEYLIGQEKRPINIGSGLRLIKSTTVFLLISLSFIFFRSESLSSATIFFGSIFEKSLFSIPDYSAILPVIFSIVLLAVEWMGRNNEFAIQDVSALARPWRWSIYLVILAIMGLFSVERQQFIYFQF